MTKSKNSVLEVNNLKKYYTQNDGIVDQLLGRNKQVIQAVDDVNLRLEENEVQGVIGESGCGKTTLLETLMGLEEATSGEIIFKGQDITEQSRAEQKQFRSDVQIIFQDPFNALDPKLTIEKSLLEPLKVHNMDNKYDRVRDALESVHLRPPERYLDKFPRQLSGGEKQRVSIARALVVDPDLILADEPVSMLDVSTQASILQLLDDLVQEQDLAMFYISHDLSTVSHICDRINVMYLGRIVERAPVKQLLEDPKHPYSQALIGAIPVADPRENRRRTKIKGDVPDPINIGEGCRFRDRCPDRMDVCEKTPIMYDLEADHQTACHLYYNHDTYLEDNRDLAPSQTTVESTAGGEASQ